MSDNRERSRSPDPPPPHGDDHHGASNGGGGGGEHEPSGDEVKLYIGNLDYATNETKLREEFSQFGEVTDVFLPVERSTSRPRGFGFVTMATRAAAESAISKLDQAQVDGRTIRVNESRPKGEGPPRGGSGFNAAGKDEVRFSIFAS